MSADVMSLHQDRPHGNGFRGTGHESETQDTLLVRGDRSAILEAVASITFCAGRVAHCLQRIGADLTEVRARLGPDLADRWARQEFGWTPQITELLFAAANYSQIAHPHPFKFVMALLEEIRLV